MLDGLVVQLVRHAPRASRRATQPAIATAFELSGQYRRAHTGDEPTPVS